MSAVSAPKSLSTVFPVIICKTMTGGNNGGHVWNDKGTKTSDLIQGMNISCIFYGKPEQNFTIYKDLKKIICSPSSVSRFILSISLLFVCPVLNLPVLHRFIFLPLYSLFFSFAIFPPDHVLENVQNTLLFSLDFKSNVPEIHFTYLKKKNVVNEFTFLAIFLAGVSACDKISNQN